MNLYEAIRWGNESEDPYTGGPDGADTCFLVRAASVEEAGQLADAALRGARGGLADWAQVLHLLGTEQATDSEPRILRGPYMQHAYRYGWRHWSRDEAAAPWVEQP